MRTRTSAVLAVLALGLGIFIYAYERRRPTTDELEERTGRVLPDFNRDSVDRVILGAGEDRIELVRVGANQPDAGPLGSVGRWRITHPRQVDADQEAVDNLLSALDWLERRRTVEEEGAADRPGFELSDPRARVSVRLRGREVILLLGADAPGESIYLAIEGQDDRVYAVSRDFLEEATREVGELRDKRLSRVRVPQANAIRVTGRFHAEREGTDRWRLRTPVTMRADVVAVENVVRELERLRASRFIADDVPDDGLGRYGLDSPRLEASIRLDGQDEAVVLRFGDECEGHGDEVYATALGSGTIACVNEEILEPLQVAPTELRDLRVTTVRADDLDGIVIARGGTEVELERRDDSWRIAGEGDGAPADAEAVENLLDALREARASDVDEDLAAAGLAGDEPRADAEVRLRLSEEAGEGAEILRFAIAAERVLLRRGSEPVVLVLPSDVASHLEPSPLRFRERRLLSERPGDAEEIEVAAAGGSRQRLTKPETSWRLVSPVEIDADESVVEDLLDSFSELEVERFVAESARAAHGLSNPRIALTVQYEGGTDGQDASAAGDGEAGSEAGPRQHTLRVGSEAPGGGFFAQLDGDSAVFVLSETFVERIDRPLVDRGLLAIEEDSVRRMVIERGEERFELERRGSSWRRGGEEVPSAPVDRILTRLSIARAVEVFSFGPPEPSMGLSPPRVRVSLTMAGGDRAEEGDRAEDREPETAVLHVGSEFERGEDRRGIYVRREGVDVTLGLADRTVAPLLEYGSSAAE